MGVGGEKKTGKKFDAKRQVASELRRLHGLGLIRRNIKPQNILISSHLSVDEIHIRLWFMQKKTRCGSN